MEFYKRKAVMEKLKGYCHLSKEHSFMEVTEWTNSELQLLSVLTNIDHG